MSYAAYGAALTRIREVLDDAAGTLRTIPAARFTEVLTEGAAEEELHRRGAISAKPFRVEITEQSRHPRSPPINSSLVLYRVTIVVTVSRTINPAALANPDVMHTLRALAWEDADAIRQALETPPNLQQTTAGTATDIAGAALHYERTQSRIAVERPPSQAQRYETRHTFTGVLKSRPATS